MTSEERREQIETVFLQGDAAVARNQHVNDNKPTRQEVTRIAIMVSIVLSLIMGGVAITVSAIASSRATGVAAAQEASQRDAESDRKLAQQAYDTAQAANQTLKNRGQVPVPVPAPDGQDPAATIAPAAAAIVLAQLPDLRPSAAALGAGIAAYFLANPVAPAGPTPGQISAVLADYFRDNPPPSGPPGETGASGRDGDNGKDGVSPPPPTDADIQRSFTDYVTAHPEFLPRELCRAYGDNFNEAKRLSSADGTQYTIYGCITEVIPGPSTDPSTTTTPS